MIAKLRIAKIVGEDIEHVIHMVKSAHGALKNASSEARSCVPVDFSKTVPLVFQTTSVSEFNSTFLTVQRDVQTTADIQGVSPVWPPLSEILSLATNTHQRLKHSGEWDGAMRKSHAHTVSTSAPPRLPGNGGGLKPACWNCGGDHLLPDCTRPRDEARIERARQRFRASNP